MRRDTQSAALTATRAVLRWVAFRWLQSFSFHDACYRPLKQLRHHNQTCFSNFNHQWVEQMTVIARLPHRTWGAGQCGVVMLAAAGVGLATRSISASVPRTAVYAAAFGLFFSTVCVIAREFARTSPTWKQCIKSLLAAVIPTALLLIVAVALIVITGFDVERFGVVAGHTCVAHPFPTFELTAAVVSVFGAASVEESIFRQWLPLEVRRSLKFGCRHRRLFSWIVAAIASQATFAASHVVARSVIVGDWQFSSALVASQFAFGLLLYAIADLSRGLAAPIAIHTIYNWVVGPLGPSERLCLRPTAILAASVVVTAAALPWLGRAIPIRKPMTSH
jgi:membrane protease YdiL (CAAX protease family)